MCRSARSKPSSRRPVAVVWEVPRQGGLMCSWAKSKIFLKVVGQRLSLIEARYFRHSSPQFGSLNAVAAVDTLPERLFTSFITPKTGPLPFLLFLSSSSDSTVIFPSAHNVNARSTFHK